jgi:predicted Rdx family selenoprotein
MEASQSDVAAVLADLNAQIDALKAEGRAKDLKTASLRAALGGVLSLVDEGLLVRDARKDGQPGSALRMNQFLLALVAARRAFDGDES